MKAIRDLLRKDAPTTAELRTALAALPIAAAAGRQGEAEAAYRSQLLITDDGRALERAERDIAEAKRECARLAAYAEELTAKLPEAEQRETLDELIVLREETAREMLAAHEAMAADARRLLDGLVDLIRRRQAAWREADTINTRLQAIGAADRIDIPPGDGGLSMFEITVLSNLVLPQA